VAAAAAATAAAEASAPADGETVKGVLAAGSAWEVLQLKKGAGAADVKRRYKELARKLHPDKCSIEGATAAFQKVQEAYSELVKVV
jgi:DnaJ-domain-containing protein 1